jgi:hypothetical protein
MTFPFQVVLAAKLDSDYITKPQKKKPQSLAGDLLTNLKGDTSIALM